MAIEQSQNPLKQKPDKSRQNKDNYNNFIIIIILAHEIISRMQARA